MTGVDMSMMSEFREFAVKGSVIDLAVGVIIGGAFGKIVDSLVKDLIMPIVGAIFGGLDFSQWFLMLGKPPAGYAGPMTYEALTKAGVPNQLLTIPKGGHGNFTPEQRTMIYTTIREFLAKHKLL